MADVINKEIVISGRDAFSGTFKQIEQSVTSVNQRLQQSTSSYKELSSSASELAKGLVSDAVKFSQSSQEQIKFIEREIALIEKRNKIDVSARKLDVEKSGGGGVSGGLAAVERAEKEDVLQVSILKDIIDTLKETSRDQILEDKKGVSDTIQALEKRKAKGEDVTAEEQFIANYQKELLGADREAVKEEQQRFSGVGAAKQFNTIAGIGTGKNELTMLAAGLTAIPLVGAGLAAITERIFDAGTRLQEARNLANAVTGGGAGGRENLQARDLSAIGYDEAVYFQFTKDLAQARQSAAYDPREQAVYGARVEDASESLLATSRNYGIDLNTILTLAASQKFDTNRRDTFGDIQNQISLLRETGALGVNGDDMSRLVSLLEIQNEMVSNQSAILEQVNTDINTKMIAAFQEIGGSFADSRAGQRIGALNRGITTPQGDFQEAFLYKALRDIFPGKDYFDLLIEQEKGLTSYNQVTGETYIGEVLRQIMSSTSNELQQKLDIKTLFNISASQTEQLFTSFIKNPELFEENISRDIRAGKTKEQVLAEAAGLSRTGLAMKSTAVTEDIAAALGEGAIEMFDKGREAFLEGIDAIKEIIDPKKSEGGGSVMVGGVMLSTDMLALFANKLGEVTDNTMESFDKALNGVNGALETVKKSFEDLNIGEIIRESMGITPMFDPKKQNDTKRNP